MNREVQSVVNELENYLFLLGKDPAYASNQVTDIFVETASLMYQKEFERLIQTRIDDRFEELTADSPDKVMYAFLIMLEALADYEHKNREPSDPLDDFEDVEAEGMENVEKPWE